MLETFEPALPIRTERLLLRPLTEADVPALLAHRGDAQVCRWLPFEPMDEAEARRRLLAEVGGVLSPQHEGHGCATEAARALIALAFDGLQAHRVIARMGPENTASAAVAARRGMRREALLIEDEWLKGAWADTLLYALLEHERPAAS